MKDDLKISLKKPSYPVSTQLKAYLQKFNRTIRLPIFYDDLLRFQGSVEVFDINDKKWRELGREWVEATPSSDVVVGHSWQGLFLFFF